MGLLVPPSARRCEPSPPEAAPRRAVLRGRPPSLLPVGALPTSSSPALGLRALSEVSPATQTCIIQRADTEGVFLLLYY